MRNARLVSVLELFTSLSIESFRLKSFSGPGEAGVDQTEVEEEEDVGVDAGAGDHGDSHDRPEPPTPGVCTPGAPQDVLTHQLVHHVGQVGEDEDCEEDQGEVGRPLLGSGHVMPYLPLPWDVNSQHGRSLLGENKGHQVLVFSFLKERFEKLC